MSIYAYQNGILNPLDNSDRVWIGTRAAWTALGDDQPKGCLVAFTDDWTDNTVETGTGTRNSNYVSADSFIADWYKLGRICTVHIQFNTAVSLASNEEIITGFPKPICPVAIVAQGNSNTISRGLVLRTNGAVRTHYTCDENTFFHVTITYITAE
jgi:hypothetical protein